MSVDTKDIKLGFWIALGMAIFAIVLSIVTGLFGKIRG
jgi:hypothetical protein